MVFGLFSSAAEKRKQKNVKMLETASKAHFFRRIQFRANAENGLREKFSDIVLLMNEQSEHFAGYSKDSSTLITGMLYDRQLPSLFDLKEKFTEDPSSEIFAFHVGTFMEEMQNAKGPNSYNWMTRTEMADGYAYEDNLFPYEIRLYKNDKIVGRSGTFAPKSVGYFDDILKTHIIHALRGSTVSTFKAEIHVTNYGECGTKSVPYVYNDTPRRDITQNYEHFDSIRCMFLRFLVAIEEDLISEDGKKGIFAPSETDIDDAKIGLPAT
jgi:hypothetical protein